MLSVKPNLSAPTSDKDHLATPGSSVLISGISKAYAGAYAIENINLDVRAGEFMSLLGPSGSGKTTTLNVLSGMTKPDKGSVSVDGRPITDMPPHKRGLGVVFQHYALFPNMTVEQNVRFPLEEQKFPKKDIPELVELALSAVRMTDFRNRFPAQLSGGQRQRVAFARAIVFRPGVLLMDEPLGALDRNLRESMQTEIKRIHREVGSTFIYVTHDQEEALALSDRIAIFDDGGIRQVGTPEDLYLNPESLFVAQFFGESNTWEGDLKQSALGYAELETQDGLFKGKHLGEHRDGRAALVVRPESITIEPEQAITDSTTLKNSVTGEIVERSFLGSSIRFRVRTISGQEVLVRVHPGSVEQSLMREQPVTIRWSSESAFVLPC